MTSRTIAVVAGAAVVALVAGAVRLAAADPLAAPEQAQRSAAPHPAKEAAAPPATRPAPQPAQWTGRKRTGVSAGVLVRAALRRPLDRGACPAKNGNGTGTAADRAADACTPAPQGAPIEIDWHGDRAAP